MLRTLMISGLLWMGSLTMVAGQSADSTVSIGVLAYRGSEALSQRWKGLEDYLNSAVPGRNFRIVPVTLTSADAQIANGQLDFLLTNPGHFVDLERHYPMSVLATRVQRKSDGSYSGEFGSAIVARRDSGLSGLQDAAGRSVAAVDRNAFGGFQLAWREFDEAGVDLFTDTAALTFTGFPMDQVMDLVLNGSADIGVLRSGLIETLVSEQVVDPADIVILNPNATYAHPDIVSTRLYPEWPFAAFATTPPDLRDQVALALLSASTSLLARQSGMSDKWSAPVSYHTVRELSDAFHARVSTVDKGAGWPGPTWTVALIVAAGGAVLAAWRIAGRRRAPQPAGDRPGETSTTILTQREQQILSLIAKGLSTKEIAKDLGISPKTVEFHRANLLKKYGARTSSQLIALTT